ncbi:MAG: DNA cytosine methyltransferase [Dehalococcoidales bacterium]
MANPNQLTVLALCAGYGGLELGLARALENSMRVVAVEIEAYALANLVAKAEEGKLAIESLYPDLRTFPAERFSGCFDIVTAGFPCQPFSVAGKRGGGTDERHLWPLISRIIEAVKPVRVVLENVPGLLSARILDNRPDLVEYLTSLAAEQRKADARGRWYIGEHRRRLTSWLLQQEGIQALAGVYLDLHDLGYTNEAGLYEAEEVGAPQKRQRLFILAHNTTGGLEGSHLSIRQPRQEQATCDTVWAGEKLAGANIGESQRRQGQPGDDGEELQTPSGSGDKWPARPGEPQHPWEEPRAIVPNASQRRAGNNDRPAGRETWWEDVRQGNGPAGPVRTDTASELEHTERAERRAAAEGRDDGSDRPDGQR